MAMTFHLQKRIWQSRRLLFWRVKSLFFSIWELYDWQCDWLEVKEPSPASPWWSRAAGGCCCCCPAQQSQPSPAEPNSHRCHQCCRWWEAGQCWNALLADSDTAVTLVSSNDWAGARVLTQLTLLLTDVLCDLREAFICVSYQCCEG